MADSKVKVKRRRVVEPVFITKMEMADHLRVGDQKTIDSWIVAGRIPPPHSQPGERHAVWLRKHWQVYVDTGAWPPEAYPTR